jgi:transcription elongation factor SPT6
MNRQQFIRGDIITTCIFENCAAFLRITLGQDFPTNKDRDGVDETELPDPLDDTRIHPEDYDLARKMAADALDLDEEDIQDEHPSYVVGQIMQAPDNAKRLDELNLDDFAVNMYRGNGDLKRHTLNTIREELLRPYSDRRNPFSLLSDWEVLTMLTSETEKTLRIGLIVSVMITRSNRNYAVVRLDSGLEGVINTQYISDNPPDNLEHLVKKGQTLQGVIIDVKRDLVNDQFGVELSSRQSDVAVGDAKFRKVLVDSNYWDEAQAKRDVELLQRKKRNEENQQRRVIKHPNFHNFTSSQAEAYLSQQQRGDVVVRPSSKGMDHLAVTWKVDDGLFQHIGK